MVISKDFILNNITNTSKDVIIVSFESDVLTRMGVPFSRNISSSGEYSSNNPVFKKGENEPDDIVLNFMYVNEYFIPQQWTESKIIDIKEWIVTDDFIPFISGDNPNYVTYMICTKIENKMTPDMLGVLECTFKPFSHYKYKRYSKKTTLSGIDKTFSVSNPSMEVYKPIITLTNLGDKSTVNKIQGFEITGLAKGETVIIDNLMKTVLNLDDENKFSLCNRTWVELAQGNNEITMSGNCEIEILCEFPVLL